MKHIFATIVLMFAFMCSSVACDFSLSPELLPSVDTPACLDAQGVDAEPAEPLPPGDSVWLHDVKLIDLSQYELYTPESTCHAASSRCDEPRGSPVPPDV